MRFRCVRSTIEWAARSAGGTAPDSGDKDCSLASDEARLLPWERDMYWDAVQKQPQQLERSWHSSVGRVGHCARDAKFPNLDDGYIV